DELAAFADVFSQPDRARAGQALHWQYVVREIPRLLRRRVPTWPLSVPTTLLFGAEDVTLSPAQLAGADGLRIDVVEGCGHHLPDLAERRRHESADHPCPGDRRRQHSQPAYRVELGHRPYVGHDVHALRKLARARCRRDFTVPTVTSRSRATSASSRPARSR